jgi:hypothetical protein
VHDPFAVRVDERLEQALRDADRILQLQRAALGQQHVDGRALDELHHQHRAGLVVDELEEARDVTVAQLRQDLRFLDEALARRGVARELLGHHFQYDRKADGQRVRLRGRPPDVDVAHPAFADLPLDAVAADLISDHCSRPSSSQ